jgi:hypothetical protein
MRKQRKLNLRGIEQFTICNPHRKSYKSLKRNIRLINSSKSGVCLKCAWIIHLLDKSRFSYYKNKIDTRETRSPALIIRGLTEEG